MNIALTTARVAKTAAKASSGSSGTGTGGATTTTSTTTAAPVAAAKTAARVAGVVPRVPGVPGVPGVGGVARVAKMGANMAASAADTAATAEPVSPPCDGATEEHLAAVGPGGISPFANMSSKERNVARAGMLGAIDTKMTCVAAKYSVGRIGLIANWQRRIFKVVGLSIIRYMKGNSPGMGFKDVHIDSSTVLYDNPTPEVHPQAKTDLDVVLSFTEKGKPLKLLIRFDHEADKKYWVQNLCLMIIHKKY